MYLKNNLLKFVQGLVVFKHFPLSCWSLQGYLLVCFSNFNKTTHVVGSSKRHTMSELKDQISFNPFSAGIAFICQHLGRQVLTYKGDLRTERTKTFIMAVDPYYRYSNKAERAN